MGPEAVTDQPLTLEEARAWVGCRVDDVAGSRLGKARGVFADAGSGEPTWLVAKLGRFSGPLVAIPISHCAGSGRRVWVAHPRRAIRGAPVVDPARALLREHELTICAHYGIGQQLGRAAEVAPRAEGSVTSHPA
ncbi:MAG TPA: PRC-barrel domain-containing protein [Solirubrobacterales bacterium]|nr:PRC-barrel domain-containing protein [Solirubrobacterales bacterium]